MFAVNVQVKLLDLLPFIFDLLYLVVFILIVLSVHVLYLSFKMITLFLESFDQNCVVLVIQAFKFFVVLKYGVEIYIFCRLGIGTQRVRIIFILNFDKFAINLILDQSIDVILFAEVPYHLSIEFHRVNMFRLLIVIVSMAFLHIDEFLVFSERLQFCHLIETTNVTAK